ncbi:MAG: RGS domain-containing protein [Benjaminiella poitrasii]|nr:MAG: RGS domain-containing protein [Benjaminiella poitrasii]
MNVTVDSIGISLESILNDQTSDIFKEFQAYLHRTYCLENLTFWIATQEYHQLSENDTHQISMCNSMINLYIRPNSPQEINIPCAMRQMILDLYNQEQYPSDLFDEAAEAVLELMRVNAFVPWIISHETKTTSSQLDDHSTVTSKQHHQSWPVTTENLKDRLAFLSSSSTHLVPSPIPERWNLIRSRQTRHSCSSLDDMSLMKHHYSFSATTKGSAALDDTMIASVPSSVLYTPFTKSRYKTMLKRVKSTLLGHPTITAFAASLTHHKQKR